MKRKRWLALGILLFSTSCERDGGIIGQGHLDGVAGMFVLEDDYRTVALTSVQHSVFYQIGNRRELVFKGMGGDQPRISLIGPDTILLRYCRGSIDKVESSFFEQPSPDNGVRILRLQVVTVPGVSIKGRSVC
ncbi:hypothetical protein [Sphingobium boeckii]|uniref:Lipoprotein n=1 Tax=Sphingobium boeckii TaxID=1082345 RepID=A0A7W9AJE5_9SPHN|nr:hypothetical protein [Sphingobium boeckii]MBB5686668.1 hypothetical protein [Sphingobium boeckii]